MCDSAPGVTGALCTACRSRIDDEDELCPEQIVVPNGLFQSEAWFVDRWGRLHALGGYTAIGRRGDLSIHAASVSRKHAMVTHVRGWQIVDLASRNGTEVNGELVKAPVALSHGDIVSFGTVRLFFVEGDVGAAGALTADVGTKTLDRHENRIGTEHPISLVSLPGGGGGVIERSGEQLSLTLLQFCLLEHLFARHQRDVGENESVRGYLSSAELLVMLPWDTATPDDVNLRHLIRRTRKRIQSLGVQIEANHGLGYRFTLS